MANPNGHHAPDDGAGDVQDLIQQARRAKPLDPTERSRLLQAAAGGDRGSQERLIEAHLELVIRLAAHRAGAGLPLGDLVQEGSIGLLEAIRNFGARGTKGSFDDFASESINKQLDTALEAEAAAVRQAELLATAASDYERVQLELARVLHRAPAEKELAEKLEWTVERLRYIAGLVADARKRHDEELLAYIDPDDADIEDDDELES